MTLHQIISQDVFIQSSRRIEYRIGVYFHFLIYKYSMSYIGTKPEIYSKKWRMPEEPKLIYAGYQNVTWVTLYFSQLSIEMKCCFILFLKLFVLLILIIESGRLLP